MTSSFGAMSMGVVGGDLVAGADVVGAGGAVANTACSGIAAAEAVAKGMPGVAWELGSVAG